MRKCNISKLNQRFFLLLPNLFSYLATVLSVGVFGVSGRMDEWTQVYTPPAILSGIVSLKVIYDFSRSHSWRRVPWPAFSSAGCYLVALAIISWVFSKNPHSTLIHLQIGFGFALTLVAIPYLMRFWEQGLFLKGAIINSFFYFSQIAFLAVESHRQSPSQIAIYGTIAGGSLYLIFCVIYAPIVTVIPNRTQPPQRVWSHQIQSWINPSTLISERMIFDQFALGLLPNVGSLSLYFIISRSLNAAFSTFLSIYLPETRRNSVSKRDPSIGPNRTDHFLSLLARGAIIFSLVFGSLCFLNPFQTLVSRYWGVLLAIIPFTTTTLLSAALLSDSASIGFSPQRIFFLKMMWLFDLSGRCVLCAVSTPEKYFLWSILISILELIVLSFPELFAHGIKSETA